MALEWFLYLEPSQSVVQTGQPGELAIEMLKNFCAQEIIVTDFKEPKKEYQRTFTEFVVHFHVCLQLKRHEITKQELIDGVNNL